MRLILELQNSLESPEPYSKKRESRDYMETKSKCMETCVYHAFIC